MDKQDHFDADISDEATDFLAEQGKDFNIDEVKESDDAKQERKKQTAKEQKKSRQKSKAKKINLTCVIIILIIVAILSAYFLIFHQSSSRKTTPAPQDFTGQPEAVKAEQKFYSPLTGLEIKDAAQKEAAATCVMIENSPDARPQSALDEAGVIYEFIAEGGITRFMAVYQEAKPTLVGPVRSARLTAVQLAKPYHCSIAHVGSAANADAVIKDNPEYRNVDQFFNADAYWRRSTKPNGAEIYAPHNMYTDFAHLDQLNQDKGYRISKFKGLPRLNADEKATQIANSENRVKAQQININISGPLYDPVYQYDAASNKYLRFHSQDPHQSIHLNGQIVQNAPDVVIAMRSAAVPRPDTHHFDYTTKGEDDAYIFQNGVVIPGKWRREKISDELRFYDLNGTAIKLNPGQIWISLYPAQSGSVEYN